MRLGPAPDGGRSPGAAGAAGSVPSRRGGSGSPGPVKVTFNGRGAARPEGVGGGREGPAFPRLRVPAAARSSGRRPGRAGGGGAFPALPGHGISVWAWAGVLGRPLHAALGAARSGSTPHSPGRARGQLRAGTLGTKPGAEPRPVVPGLHAVWGLAWPWHSLCPLLLPCLARVCPGPAGCCEVTGWW